MRLLDAINDILPALGERRVTSVDSRNPTLAVILPAIDREVRMLLATGWWFNRFDVELFPNSEGEIDVPEDTLSFVPYRGELSAVQRGERFYNGATRSYVFPNKVRGLLIQYVPFEELPESAAHAVLYSALVSCYLNDIGLEQVVTEWKGMASAALFRLEQENLRQRKFSIKESRRWVNLRNAMRG